MPIPTHFRGVLRVKHPKISNYIFLIQKGSSLLRTASFELLCVKIGSRVCAVALLKNKKVKKSQYMLP